MPDVLNPSLYQRLEKLFGHVRVSNAGLEMQARVLLDPEGKTKLDFSQDGEQYCICCFAGETLVATPAGDVPISALVGKATLLVPNTRGLGNWQRVVVRSFGIQPLRTIHLRRRRATKTIRATLGHRWLLQDIGPINPNRRRPLLEATTAELRPGDRLASCFARKLSALGKRASHVSAAGVAQGFVFGDGSAPLTSDAPAHVLIYAKSKDAALLPYFAGHRTVPVLVDGKTYNKVCDLPRFWKRLPPADESVSFLLGWLAGYFAADGHVSKGGHQAVLYSADPKNLEFVRGVCYRFGIRVSPMIRKRRSSDGCVPGASKLPLYSVSFPVRDVPEEFWIQAHHRERALAWLSGCNSPQRSYWTVERVEDLGEVEEVYCAVVPGAEAFTLADNILTRNCPYCNDARFRFYVSYMYGRLDEAKRPMTFLAWCFNEDCMKDYRNRLDFEDRVEILGQAMRSAAVHKGLIHPDGACEVALPGTCLPLHELPLTHPANAYLLSRGFDPHDLSLRYQVSYCLESRYYLARERICIPIYERGVLRGWQTRYIGELPWKDKEKARGLPPKYFSCPNSQFRSQCLYNFDEAAQWEVGVVVEGAGDVWSFGAMSCCLFGNTMTPSQKSKLLGCFQSRQLVLLLDPQEYASPSTQALIAELYTKVTEFVPVKLPDGTDPGSLDRAFLREYVREAAADRGMRVVYRRHHDRKR